MVESSPVVSNGVVYVGSFDHKLYAFDAAGAMNCTAGPPKTCGPLWTAATNGLVSSSPAVANGIVYVGSFDYHLYAFDAAGSMNCTGVLPAKTCAPLWIATTNGELGSSPAIAKGLVYVPTGDTLYAFDAAGSVNCTGGPPTKTCSPRWTASLNSGNYRSSPAVANGVVYVGSAGHELYAFDAGGTKNCVGGPPTKTCVPLWTGTAGPIGFSSPAIQNGIVFIGDIDGDLNAFDATGHANCTGGPPTKTCAPLWAGPTTANVSMSSSPAPVGAVVYVGSNDGKLYAFGLPKS
jgi:outer membrane protein assembly factor BamB